MSLPVARLTDLFTGICCCHLTPIPMVGMIITASSNTISNNLGNARISDVVLGGCGHIGIIVSASPNVLTNNRHQAHLTSSVVGCLVGIIVTGSSNTYVS